jgi:hypothetical protein
MRGRIALLLAAAIGSAKPARADTVLVPCALPREARFVLTIEQHGWTRGGAPSLVTLRRDLGFAVEGEGRLLTLGPARATSDLTGPERDRFALAYRAGREQPARIHVDGAGRVVGIDDLAGHWQAYLDLLAQLADLADAQGEPSARTRAVLAALKDADLETRMAAVDGPVVPLLRLCGQAIAQEPGDSAGPLVVAERIAGAAVVEEDRYTIARETGLVTAIERRLTPVAQPDRPQVEYWRLEPAP